MAHFVVTLDLVEKLALISNELVLVGKVLDELGVLERFVHQVQGRREPQPQFLGLCAFVEAVRFTLHMGKVARSLGRVRA